MKLFQVAVYLDVRADDADDAFSKVDELMADCAEQKEWLDYWNTDTDPEELSEVRCR